MNKILLCGGMGDMLMGLSKLHKRYGLDTIKDKSKTKLTHVEVPSQLINSIREFYYSQDIEAGVFSIPNWKWLDEHEKEFDLVLKSYDWFAIPANNNMENAPFLPIKYNHIPNSDVLIQPFSGWRMNRTLDLKEINTLIKENPHRQFKLAGWIPQNEYSKWSSLEIENHCNKTTMKEFTDLVCSSRTIITPLGVCMFLGTYTKREVFGLIKETPGCRIEDCLDPRWNLTRIDSVTEVKL
jgi:hypothetical protein